MKALFTAIGSIGIRHAKNLTKICGKKGIDLSIDAIRYTNRNLSSEEVMFIDREIRNDSDAAPFYDVVFITGETGMHKDNIARFHNKCNHMFIEKPVFDNPEVDISSVFTTAGGYCYVAAPIRFSKYFETIKKVVSENSVYAARIIFSSYMPEWQKGRDYRKSFRCYNDRGGGVDIDSIHEIDYMMELFGRPKRTHRVTGKYSNLEMESCDLASFIFEYDDKIVEMHLDYFGRTNNRRIELFCKDDVIIVDFNKKTCVHELDRTCNGFEPDDRFYENEMEYFVDLICSDGGMVNINPPERALETLRIAKGMEGENDTYGV